MNNLWDNDGIQFARLLSEIDGIGLTDSQYMHLRDSMDLSNNEINEIFDRANKAFEAILEVKST